MNKITLCEKVKQKIRKLISSMPDKNASLPSERQLAEKLKVSRITVRNAYHALVNEGVLVALPRGYKLRPLRHEGVLTVDGFTRGLGMEDEVATEMLGMELISPSPDAVMALNCRPSDRVIRIRRLRRIGGKPCQIEYCHILEERFPGLMKEKDHSSLYKIFEQSYGISIIRAEQILTVMQPAPDIRKLLELPSSSPILFLKRTSYDQRNRPTESVELYVNPEGREFYMELKR